MMGGPGPGKCGPCRGPSRDGNLRRHGPVVAWPRWHAWRLFGLVTLVAVLTTSSARGQASDAPADEAERARALERRAAERLAALQREADALARQQRGLLDRLRELELRRKAADAELERADAAVAVARAEVALLTARIAATERAIAARRPAIQHRLAALYRSGPDAALRRWLVSGPLDETTAAERLLAAVTARDQREFSQYLALRVDLARQQDHLRQRQQELDAHLAAVRAARDATAQAAAAHRALIRDVDTRRDLASQLASELAGARDRLQQQLAGLDPDSPTVTLPLKAFRGELPWPAPGRVIGGFGRHATSRFGTSVRRNGIELRATPGIDVRAVHEGRVAFADAFAGFGRLVIVDHGGRAFSLYGHLDEVSVTRGATVDRGTRLGSVGYSPAGTPALYFELRVDGRPVNPLEWLNR